MNPYNCTKPGNLFVGYQRLRQELFNGFCDGNSYAVLGGRRCGKTSLLIQIEKDLQEMGLEHFHPLPRRFSMQEFSSLTVSFLFKKIYDLIVQDLDVEPLISAESGHEYQNFLSNLDKVHLNLSKVFGSNWVVILLIDELDAALASLPDEQFFQNLRNFLMESRFRDHFRVVATGVQSMARLIYSGSSPLNNLRHKYLGILTNKQARELVRIGYTDNYDVEHLFKLTGKHPFLLQGILEKLWNKEWDNNRIKSASRDFLREQKDFYHWLDAFGPAERAVYRCIAEAPQGGMNVFEIKNKIDSTLVSEIDKALTVLIYHGVIDDSDPDEPEIAGTLFRNWFLSKFPESSSESSATESPEQDRADSNTNSTAFNIQISPTITGASIQQGFTPEQVKKPLDLFADLKNLVSEMSVDKRTKMKVQHTLDEAIIELTEPKSGAEPDKKKVKSSIEKATRILKSTNDMVQTLNTFIEKAQKLAPYLGQAAGWLSGLV